MSNHQSYWLKQALEREPSQPMKTLEQTISADVAIVGGGYTGLWTAIMLKEQQPEMDVVILEKDMCGSGASGANGGCMLTWATKYPTMKRLFGESQAKWLVKESENVIFEIDDYCKKHNIDAEIYRNGTYYTATNSAQKGSMDPVINELDKLGVNSWSKCKDDDISGLAGSHRHVEGYYSPAAASVQPALLVRGLRKRAIELGVTIYERSAMTKLDYGDIPVVHTENGKVKAGKVVLALNAWMASHFKHLKNSIVVVSSDMVITEPLGEKLKETGPKKGATVVDSRIFVHYYRDTKDGRLMLGKGGNQFSFGNDVDSMFNKPSRYFALLTDSFSRLFPKLENPKIVDNWTGGSDRSVTGLPFFHYLGDQNNIVYGFGYSGNGVAQTRIGGKILSSMVLELDNRWTNCGLTRGPLGYFPPEPFRWLGAMVVRNAVRRKEEAEDNESQPNVWDRWLSKLAGPAGKADKIS
ncbi:FAD-dependent oxidoreductase [Vibrio sp. 10N.261.55.A7]|uniref:FAD-dependent oxidoreductase n=1 Tax=Vibrio sp. 10N.261.55.A7 TaxID=1880851 RepID=UPI000C84D4A5|nr:FAD-dependent oxidoreductase [Vibrio sp. 10N.261.55.A7]PMJ92987.1 FAD-dependent oxidoreductase [Vibrio sp. 10N.261.55.A7]